MDKKRTVLITGSSRGIGKSLVEVFSSNEYNIIAHARSKTDSFESDMKRISERSGVLIKPIYFDMTDISMMKTAIKKLYTDRINIDVLINNAGIAHGSLFQMTPISRIRDVFEVNLFSHMELTQLILRPMVKQKSGCIINLSSISGLDLKVGNCAYGVSKAAMIAFTKTLAAEVGGLGLRVNAIAPGLTDTKMAEQMEEHAGISMLQGSAMNRLAKPEEIANVALFLASSAASFINGQVIRVDGGSQ